MLWMPAKRPKKLPKTEKIMLLCKKVAKKFGGFKKT